MILVNKNPSFFEKRTRSIYTLILIIVMSFFISCGNFPVVTENDYENTPVRNPDIDPVKYKRIVLLCEDSSFLDSMIEGMLNLGCYDVVTRDRLDMILREQNLQYSGRFDLDTAVKWGKLVGASGIFEITDIGYRIENSPLFNGAIWGYGWFTIKGYDVEKGKIILLKRSGWTELPANGRFNLVSLALSYFHKNKIFYKGTTYAYGRSRIIDIRLFGCQ